MASPPGQLNLCSGGCLGTAVLCPEKRQVLGASMHVERVVMWWSSNGAGACPLPSTNDGSAQPLFSSLLGVSVAACACET